MEAKMRPSGMKSFTFSAPRSHQEKKLWGSACEFYRLLMMANLPGELNPLLLASIPGLLEVLGSWITEAIFWWYLPILELATWLRKEKLESYLGSRGLPGSFYLRQERKQIPEKSWVGDMRPCIKRLVYKRATNKRYFMSSEVLAVLVKDEFAS